MLFEDSYGELANHLVLQSKQSMNLAKLLPYDDTLVWQVIQEHKELDKKLQAMESNRVEMGDPKWPVVVISARVMHQSKQCLLAYHSQRLDIIRTAYWEAGGAASHVLGQLQQNMSQLEIQYLRDYRDSVVIFCNNIFPDDIVDLTLGMTDPLKQLTIAVETIVSPGPIHTQSGIIDFQHGQC
ncbi:hypothetical protein B0H14DRAFT_2555132 [Mycena olivaceomarginata]|nr:hypothetical protein B0H14DRAFT_2555132 [Mycena olivaceomarginata]